MRNKNSNTLNRNKFNNYMSRIMDRRRQRNINEFLNLVNETETLEDLPYDAQVRIYNEADRTGDDANEIFNEMRISPRLARHYAKNATKQNHAEKYQINIIERQIQNTSKYEKNTDLLFVENGAIKNVRGKLESTSVDVAYKYKGKNIFCTLKYTDGNGGAQDRQKGNVINFLNEASKSRNENNIFVAVLDGTYYNTKTVNMLKERYANKSNIVITDSYSFKADLDSAL